MHRDGKVPMTPTADFRILLREKRGMEKGGYGAIRRLPLHRLS